jgi:hypothetical protein
MADDDPPPNVDVRRSDAVTDTVQAFLDVMEAGGAGTEGFAPAVRKLYDFKVSLYLSVDDPNVPNAVHDEFAKWLNELSRFPDLKGANLQVTNCENAFLSSPTSLRGREFQMLTDWKTTKSGTRQNIYICVKMKCSIPFSKLKHRMRTFLNSSNVFMKRNHSLGDSSEEMATIGYLSPVHPDLVLENIQLELNKEILCINAQKDDDFLAEHSIFRGVLGEVVIAHGGVRCSSKKHGDVNNSRAVVVECPKSKVPYYMQTVQESLRTFNWSPDMKKVKFVPFSLKNDPKTKEVFADMLVYNSLENNNKAFAQILGVSRDDMLEIRGLLITNGPTITHVEPTQLSDKQGRWRIYTSQANLESLETWLKENLAAIIDSLDMRSPVPGFETPRLVSAHRISSHHVQEIAAIAMTVPNLEDASDFPNLVIRRGRHVNRGRPSNPSGAWTSPTPLVFNATASTPPSIPSPRANPNLPPLQSQAPPSAVLLGITQQLEANRKWRLNLETSRQAEKIEFQKQMACTNLILEQLTEGQTGLQHAMTQQNEQVAFMRKAISDLTESVRELLHIRTNLPISTPPRLQRADLVTPASASENVLGPYNKRSPDRSLPHQNPTLSKLSRIAEGMQTDDQTTAHHHP